jgi:hypothetical protein
MTKNNFKGRHQFSITTSGITAREWKIENSLSKEAYWIQFNILSPTILLNGNKDPLGKIYSPKAASLKKNFDMNLQSCLIRAEWSRTCRTFKLVGNTDLRGFEKFDFAWKREKLNQNLVLEDCSNGQCVAEFLRHKFSKKEIGDVFIYPDLPKEINLLIAFSASYNFKHI